MQTMAKSSVARVMMTPMYGPGLKSLYWDTGGATSAVSGALDVAIVVDSACDAVVDDVDDTVWAVLVGRV